MKIITKLFGEIELDDAKIITFPNGIIGFPDMKQYLLIHDAENKNGKISWLQSVEEPGFAMPVIDPLKLLEEYDPFVEDEMLAPLGTLKPDEMLVLVTMTIPSDITRMTANFRAPIVINAANRTACQLIVDNEEYQVKHPVYQLLKKEV